MRGAETKQSTMLSYHPSSEYLRRTRCEQVHRRDRPPQLIITTAPLTTHWPLVCSEAETLPEALNSACASSATFSPAAEILPAEAFDSMFPVVDFKLMVFCASSLMAAALESA